MSRPACGTGISVLTDDGVRALPFPLRIAYVANRSLRMVARDGVTSEL